MRTLTEYELTHVAGGFTFEGALGMLGSLAGLGTGLIGGGLVCFYLGGYGALRAVSATTVGMTGGRINFAAPSPDMGGAICSMVLASIGTVLTTLAGGYIGGYIGRAAGRVVDYFGG